MNSAIVIFVFVSAAVLAQDFAYPAENQRLDEDADNKRIPLYIPGRCAENELLYPGDHESDWICDCAPGFIYYPPKGGCFEAYRQGPCANNSHLVLKQTEVSPKCVDNPCKKDGKVMYHRRCYELDKPGPPCDPVERGGGIFGVNATTLKLECLKGTDRLSLFQFPTRCPPGSKRDSTNTCREIF